MGTKTSSGKKRVRSKPQKRFWKLLRSLQPEIQYLAKTRYKNVFREDPRHPMLDGEWYTHKIKGRRVYRVEVGQHYRALAFYDESADTELFIWYWIGSHEDYNGLVKRTLKKR